MMRTLILSLIMAWALTAPGAAPARADENSIANRLMVETVWLLEQAREGTDPEKRFELITKVEANPHQVIARYPGSNVAIRLDTNELNWWISDQISARLHV